MLGKISRRFDYEELPSKKNDDIAMERKNSTLLFRWYSSIWKLLWADLVTYLLLYSLVSVVYRFVLNHHHQELLEMMIIKCRSIDTGDMAFLLGFYVSWVISRWWDQYLSLPFIDELAITLAGVKPLTEEEEANLLNTNKTVIRYCILSYILALRRMSQKLQRRFPTMNSLINTGIVTSSEVAMLEDDNSRNMKFKCKTNWWVPIQWCQQLAKADKSLSEVGPIYFGVLGLISKFQNGLQNVLHFEHVPIPLAYSQVVHLAVYLYFAVQVIAEQFIVGDSDELDLKVPLMLIAKFLFYFGWLKVACEVYNPFGDDDDDIEVEALIDRHLKTALRIVDPKSGPPLPKNEPFWGDLSPRLSIDDSLSISL